MRLVLPFRSTSSKAKCLIKLTVSLSFAVFKLAQGQSNSDSINIERLGRFEYSFKNANSKAKILMNEDFFWSPTEETAPFGSDDGSDAAYGFHEWRILNKNTDPFVFLKELIGRWNYPFFNWNELDTNKIRAYCQAGAILDESAMRSMKESFKEMYRKSGEEISDAKIEESIKASGKGMGRIYLLGLDNAIIGTGFAQLALEGHMDDSLKQITITAINRELLPILIAKYDEQYQKIRKEQLIKMLTAMQHSS